MAVGSLQLITRRTTLRLPFRMSVIVNEAMTGGN
jgi:hypothetical protein